VVGETAAGCALDKLGVRAKVLAVPPDFTRMHSMSGQLTEYAWNYYGDALTDVLPALGTHKAMTDHEIQTCSGRRRATCFGCMTGATIS
jgi:hypothetical protein